MEKYSAIHCPCGMEGCVGWNVWPVAAGESVYFTKEQAEAVAELLNNMEKEPAAQGAGR